MATDRFGHNLTRWSLLGCLPLAMLIASCDARTASDASPMVVDSAGGVRTVSLTAVPGREAQSLGTSRLFTTSEGASQLALYQVSGAVLLDDHSLVIGHASVPELLVLDSTGVPERSFGGRGEGPGEFETISSLAGGPGDTILAYDARLRRITIYTSSGELVRTDQLGSSGRYRPIAYLGGFRVVGIQDDNARVPEDGEVRQEVVLTVLDLATAGQDTLGAWAGLEMVSERGSREGVYFTFPVAYGATLATDAAGSDFLIGTTDSLALTWFSGTSPVATFNAPPTDQAVTDSDADAIREVYGQWFGPEASELPVRSRFPSFRGFVLDDSSRIWLGSFEAPGGMTRDWTLLSSEGEVEGRVSLPALPALYAATRSAVHFGVQHELLDVRSDRILLLRQDSLGVESVEVWRLDARGDG